jgi:peptide/nickel transport system permease protein
MVILFCVVVVALSADFIAPYDYAQQNIRNRLLSPSEKFYFGTDEFGRDILSRIIYGSRVSLVVGFIAVGIALFSGGLLGAVAGFYGQRIDNIIMRIMDIFLSIPAILMSISIAATLGPGLFNLMVAVGISTMPRYARVVRSSVLSLKGQEFIEAARAVGSSNFRILFRHVLPNCMAPIIVQSTLGVAQAILLAAGLSFIGLGIQPPYPEWGAMLSEGRTFIRTHPHLTFFPGLAIMITILALNFLGDGLRDVLDPKLKR